jgi:hypothetical protein
MNAIGNKGGGRKTAYKPEYANIAKRLALLGATDKDIAEAFDVCETTINAWKSKHIEFSEARKEGKMFADAKVAVSLYKRACGYSHPGVHISNYQGEITVTEITKHYPPDATSCIFWLKNGQRGRWTDRREFTGAEGDPLIPEKQNDLETVRRAAFVIAKALHQQDDDCDH